MSLKASNKIAAENFVSHYDIHRPVNWAEHFDRPGPLEVEIGFGLGEFLIQLARQNPDRNFVGFENDWARVHKALAKAKRIKSEAKVSLNNLRFLHVDAQVAFERLFAPRSIHRLHSLFPCPWPKKKHVKYRLFSHDFLKLMNSRLIDRGEAKIVTDHAPFLAWVQEEARESGFKMKREVIAPQFDTKFERKWCELGQKEFFVLELVKEQHFSIPVLEDCELKTYTLEKFDPERFEFANIIDRDSISVILKEFLFDPIRQRGMIRLVAVEKTITQNVWLMISTAGGRRSPGKWSIAPAVGQAILPTPGIAMALEAVYCSAQQTIP